VIRRFMLDTDSVSFAMNGRGNVAARIRQHHPSELCVSAITVAELRFGAARRESAKTHRYINRFVATVEVLSFDESCAAEFGRIASDLARRGLPIGDFDVLIAAHAISVDATLVTNNVKHFARVEGLRFENWY
jgi:tRNA(fMet)-specific endonuclease VapC